MTLILPDLDFLIRAHHNAAMGFDLQSTELEEITRQFLGWNDLLELTDYFTGACLGSLPNHIGGPVTGVTWGRVQAALMGSRPLSPSEIEVFQAPEVQEAFANQFPENPWREIHCWLACESLLRACKVSKSSLFHRAERVFKSILELPDDPLPENCNTLCLQRSKTTIQAFRNWYETRCGEIEAALHHHVVPQMSVWASLTYRECRRRLADHFRPQNLQPLITLVKGKHEQIFSCKRCIWSGTPLDPTLKSHLSALMAELLYYRKQNRPKIVLKPHAVTLLENVVAWVKTYQLYDWNPLREAFEQLPTSSTFPSSELEHVLEALELLSAALMRRRLGQGWGNSLQVCDLFAHPVAFPFVFKAWYFEFKATGI